MGLHAILAGLAGVLAAQGAPASSPVAPSPPTTLTGVAVEASKKPLEQQVQEYVTGIARRPQFYSLIRWREPICPLVAGLPQTQGEYVLARLSQVAREVGAPLAGPDCEANLFVVVSDEPAVLLTLWRGRDRRLFGKGLPATVERFIETNRPVRAWHNWRYEAPGGREIPREAGNFNGAPTTNFSKSSRLVENAVRVTASAIVVVDAGRLEDVKVAQLADYVAMVGFTKLRADLETGEAPTILTLFEEGRSPPAGMTTWDMAFLRGLYGTPQENRMQRAAIAGRVLREARREPAP